MLPRLLLMMLLALAAIRADAGPLRIVTAEEPPTNYTEHGDLQGMSTEIVRALLTDLKLPQDIEVLPWARALQLALNEPDVLIFTAGKTPERVQHGFTFIGPVTTRRHILYALDKQTPAIKSLEDVRQLGLRIGGLRGDWRTAYFAARGIPVEETATHLQTRRKLQQGRIDLMISSDLEMAFHALRDAPGQPLKEAYVFEQRDAYLLLSRQTEQKHIQAWEAAFLRLQKSGFFSLGAKRWSAKLGAPIDYRPESGYFVSQQKRP